MSRLNKSIFNPIELKNSSSDFFRFIILGIKFKYSLVYVPFLFISYFLYKLLYSQIYTENVNSYFAVFFLITFSILIFNLFNAINSKLIFERFNGNKNYKIKNAFEFINSNLPSFIFPHVIISIITSFFIIFLYFLFKLSEIPSIGNLVLSTLYLIYFFISLVIIFNIFVLFISIFFNSSIFCIYGGDAFTSTFKIFSLASSNLFKLIKNTILNFIISSLLSLFCFIILYFNFILINNFFLDKKQHDYLKLITNSIINNKSIYYNNYIDQISHTILEFNLLFILFFLISTFLSFINVGNFICISNIKKYSQ